MENKLIVESDARGVTTITLNRPEKRNALSLSLLEQLLVALERLEGQRVLVLRGAGPAFCTGLDLSEGDNLRSAQLIADLLQRIARSPWISIAVIHGYAVAGGAGLASVCDYVLAAEGTRIGFPEVHRGLVPAIVFSFMQRGIREKDLRELFLFGELVTMRRAEEMGLVNRSVPSEKLEEEIAKMVDLALRGAPGAIAYLKKLFSQQYPVSLDDALAIHREIRTKAEAKEGMSSFIEKREPKWFP